MSFRLHGFCCKWEGWDPVNQFNHNRWVDAVTTTGPFCMQSMWIRTFHRTFIETFFVLSFCFVVCYVDVRDFVIGLSQIISFVMLPENTVII